MRGLAASVCLALIPAAAGAEEEREAEARPVNAGGSYVLRFGQPFVVTIAPNGRPRALLAVEARAEVARQVAEAPRAELLLRDAVVAELAAAAAGGRLGRGAAPPPAEAVQRAITDALGPHAPRGAEGIEVIRVHLMPLRRR